MNRAEQLHYRVELLEAINNIPLLELKSFEKIAQELNYLGYTSPRCKKLTAMTIYRVIQKNRRPQSTNNSDF